MYPTLQNHNSRCLGVFLRLASQPYTHHNPHSFHLTLVYKFHVLNFYLLHTTFRNLSYFWAMFLYKWLIIHDDCCWIKHHIYGYACVKYVMIRVIKLISDIMQAHWVKELHIVCIDNTLLDHSCNNISDRIFGKWIWITNYS